MKKSTVAEAQPASALISQRIADLGDWRGTTLSRMRGLIQQADPAVVEEWKWGVPVWSHDGIICTGESYQKAVKLTFAKGAFLKDPAGLFTSSLDGNVRRAIDIHQGEDVDVSAFKALVRQAVALNRGDKPKPAKLAGKATAKTATAKTAPAKAAAVKAARAKATPAKATLAKTASKGGRRVKDA